MEDFSVLKKANYGKNVCTQMEGGVIFFDPDSLKEVVGAGAMTYDEYLDVQFQSMGKMRSYFEMCYFNYAMEFKGQILKITKNNVCFKRVYVSGMYSDGDMILSILVDTFFARISMPKQQYPEIHNISAA